jgi:hypothetical protein
VALVNAQPVAMSWRLRSHLALLRKLSTQYSLSFAGSCARKRFRAIIFF